MENKKMELYGTEEKVRVRLEREQRK